MSVKLLIDMNLSPYWVSVLNNHGWQAVHWSTVGDPRASDRTIMEWAIEHGYTANGPDGSAASYKRGSISRTSAVIAFERRTLPTSLFRIDSNALARR